MNLKSADLIDQKRICPGLVVMSLVAIIKGTDAKLAMPTATVRLIPVTNHNCAQLCDLRQLTSQWRADTLVPASARRRPRLGPEEIETKRQVRGRAVGRGERVAHCKLPVTRRQTWCVEPAPELASEAAGRSGESRFACLISPSHAISPHLPREPDTERSFIWPARTGAPTLLGRE